MILAEGGYGEAITLRLLRTQCITGDEFLQPIDISQNQTNYLHIPHLALETVEYP